MTEPTQHFAPPSVRQLAVENGWGEAPDGSLIPPLDEVTPGISVERQTLFWIRDELWKCVHSTVPITPQQAAKYAADIDAVLNGEPTTRGSRVRF